jgi:hypothetical protein
LSWLIIACAMCHGTQPRCRNRPSFGYPEQHGQRNWQHRRVSAVFHLCCRFLHDTRKHCDEEPPVAEYLLLTRVHTSRICNIHASIFCNIHTSLFCNIGSSLFFNIHTSVFCIICSSLCFNIHTSQCAASILPN